MNSSNRSSNPEHSDADVSLLLYKTGQAFKQFLLWIGRIFIRLGKAVLVGLLFLMRNILWLIAGTLIGIGYGFLQVQQHGTHYVSEMTVKANFNSTRSLYNTIDYMNALLNSGKTEDLVTLFNITPEEAKQLINFSANSVESELITADMYQEQFMQYDRTIKIRRDTFWLRTLKYNDFKEALTKFDFPYHQITVTSTNATIFPKLQKGIVGYISKNELFQEVKNRQAISNKDEEKLITSAIKNIDTLRLAYNARLLRGDQTNTPGSSQLNIFETNPELSTPELDLYDKMLELQDELKKSRKRNSTEQDIIEIFSSFNPVGRRLTFFNQIGTRYAIIGFSFSLGILLFIAIYKSLAAFERANRKKAGTKIPSDL